MDLLVVFSRGCAAWDLNKPRVSHGVAMGGDSWDGCIWLGRIFFLEGVREIGHAIDVPIGLGSLE